MVPRMARSEAWWSAIAIQFGADEWQEEVERYRPSAIPRARAQTARRAIEAGSARLNWRRCRPEDGPSGTRLPHCLKVYVPLDKEGASAAPYGFVFELQRTSDDSLKLNFLAFGERHPENERTKSVYARAHKRLHGRYP
jgi:hypothetical protein